jgi:hypothetical protein
VSGVRASTHGGSFIPLVGPEAEIVRILQGNYEASEDLGDGNSVVLDEENAAREIVALFREQYGVEA